MPNKLNHRTNSGMRVQNWMLNQASLGLQGGLVISSTPSGAESLIGTLLREATLSVAGDYYCDVFIGGTAALEVRLKPQFTGSSDITADIYTTYDDGTTALQTFSYSPAADMTDNTLLVASLAARKGEQWARVKLPLTGSGTATFDVAEINGQ